MTENQPTGTTFAELAVGDWIAPGVISALAAEVLHTLTYPHPGGNGRTHLVLREFGQAMPFDETYENDFPVSLATEEELAGIRAGADRAGRIADIRAFADWLEANPWVPLPNHLSAAKQLNGSETDPVPALAKVREIADRLGVKTDEHLDDRTRMEYAVGTVTYSLLSWHKDGRPAEPAPADWMAADTESIRAAIAGAIREPDPTGLGYTRVDDDADDPTPVSGARIAPQTGGMTDGGLVDETDAPEDELISSADADILRALDHVVDTEAGLRRIKEAR
jgi:hypothetical protein